jgi:hypothetical protein
MRRFELRELLMFVLLVAVAIVGRWAQPTWNLTPLVAVAAMGGYYFRRFSLAILLPAVAITVSNTILPSYNDWAIFVAVVVMLVLPAALGRMARLKTAWQKAGVAVACGLLPATAFFLVTNLLVWGRTSLYEHSLAGLAICYSAGLPFYRTMLVGDICYVSLFAGYISLAGPLSELNFSESLTPNSA